MEAAEPVISLLYIEDEQESRELFSKVFRNRYPSLELHVESSAELGLAYFRNFRPEIVVTDINLPVMSGIQLACEIRSLCTDTEIIALTAHNDTEYLLEAIRIGINHYILKPLELDRIFNIIDKAVARIGTDRQVRKQYGIIRKLSQAIEQTPLGMMITDADGFVQYVNREFSVMTGYGPDAVVGRLLWVDQGAPHLPASTCDEIRSALVAGQRWSGEIENCKKSGETYWESVSISPVRGETGAVTDFIIVREEITVRIRDRQHIQNLNIELAQKATELETINQELESFNYTVAHDLRTPLIAIKGLVDLLLLRHRTTLDPQSQENLGWINSEIIRLNGLISAILRFTCDARKPIDKKWIDLSSMVREVTDQLRAKEPQRQVRFRIAEVAYAFCDPVLVRIVLENLLGNAWKYCAKTKDACIEFGCNLEKEPAVFFVRDNGAGFENGDSSRLFQVFQRSKGDEGVEGYGIGLATASKIVQRHGGKMWAEGEAGKGAAFYFSL